MKNFVKKLSLFILSILFCTRIAVAGEPESFEIFENFDERPKSLLYSIAMDSYMFSLPGTGMGDSLGLPLVFLGLCISAPDWAAIAKLVLVALFVWVTSPTGSHLIARLELTSNEHPENEMEVVEK